MDGGPRVRGSVSGATVDCPSPMNKTGKGGSSPEGNECRLSPCDALGGGFPAGSSRAHLRPAADPPARGSADPDPDAREDTAAAATAAALAAAAAAEPVSPVPALPEPLGGALPSMPIFSRIAA